jgi:hypothetical protein
VRNACSWQEAPGEADRLTSSQFRYPGGHRRHFPGPDNRLPCPAPLSHHMPGEFCVIRNSVRPDGDDLPTRALIGFVATTLARAAIYWRTSRTTLSRVRTIATLPSSTGCTTTLLVRLRTPAGRTHAAGPR